MRLWTVAARAGRPRGSLPWRKEPAAPTVYSGVVIEERPDLGATLAVGEHAVRVGTCSWTDKTLTEGSDWYPRRTMSAEDRLRFYAAQFPLVEVDSTYYRPPAEQQSELWVERTPHGFRFEALPVHPRKEPVLRVGRDGRGRRM